MSVSAEHQGLLDRLFPAIDGQDMTRFLACIAPDATFRFGSSPVVTGHEAIRDAVDGFFASIAGLRHRIDKVRADGSTLVCEGEVTYDRHDDRQITLPFANVFAVQDGLITDYRIHIDIASLYAD